jgi:hypothetical protein
MMSLFGKKKEPKQPSTADTLALLAENIALLEKKQEHLQAKVRGEIDLTVLVALFEEFFLFCFFLFFFLKKKKKKKLGRLCTSKVWLVRMRLATSVLRWLR